MVKKELIISLIILVLILPSFISAEENESGGFFETLFGMNSSTTENNTNATIPQQNYSETEIIIPSSIKIDLLKESYQPQETLLVTINGNFFSLAKENINIYKQGIPKLTPVISGLTKQNNIYYFYAVLPNQEGNFSLKIENVEYTDMGEKKDIPIILANHDFSAIFKTKISQLIPYAFGPYVLGVDITKYQI